jgi:hypothetical protein
MDPQPLQLFQVDTVPRLTDRQKFAFDAITGAGYLGLQSDELGAVLHRPKHGLNDRCPWCATTGAEIGRALRAKGLVQQRRRRAPGGEVYTVWTVSGDLRKPVDRDYALPEGF